MVFGIIYLFAYVAISVTNSILPETASFITKLLHHEERAKSSPENPPNSINPLASNIDSGNDAFTFKKFHQSTWQAGIFVVN